MSIYNDIQIQVNNLKKIYIDFTDKLKRMFCIIFFKNHLKYLITLDYTYVHTIPMNKSIV